MQEEIIKTIIQTAIPTIIGLIPTLFLTTSKWFKNANELMKQAPIEIKNIKEKIDVNNTKIEELRTLTTENDLAMLWSQLTSKCKAVIEADYCDIQTMECINQLFDRYKKIGGNHGVEVMVKQARAICRQSKGEPRKEIKNDNN